jgi:hypothetical protein
MLPFRIRVASDSEMEIQIPPEDQAGAKHPARDRRGPQQRARPGGPELADHPEEHLPHPGGQKRAAGASECRRFRVGDEGRRGGEAGAGNAWLALGAPKNMVTPSPHLEPAFTISGL